LGESQGGGDHQQEEGCGFFHGGGLRSAGFLVRRRG
jgi:hypothetical protein